MNPFFHPNFHGAKFKKFNQENYLHDTDNGICFALALTWLQEFFSPENATMLIQRDKQIDLSFFEPIKEKQKALALPEWTSYGFHTEVGKIVKNYGLMRDFGYSLNNKDTSNLCKMAEHNSAALIFFKKNAWDKVGHVIAIASRKTKTHNLEIGIFDANYGELLFNYDYLVDFKRKRVFEEDETNDIRYDKPIRTYEDAINDLIYFYSESEEKQQKDDLHNEYTAFKILYYKNSAQNLKPEQRDNFINSNIDQNIEPESNPTLKNLDCKNSPPLLKRLRNL